MIYAEDEYLQLSGIQHFSFCRRQWALMYIEQQWKDNLRTIEGEILHERAHDEGYFEKRGELLIVRGLPIQSQTLGISGQCDVVEFHADPFGVTLPGREGLWRPYPVEYKRGVAKVNDADRLQLCAQAMCLEEMLCCEVPEGALYYGKTRRREIVILSGELREAVLSMFAEMHEYHRRGYTPKVKTGSFCRACSLNEVCLPKLCKNTSAKEYLHRELGGGET
ncbi:MAG: CRISPR-associated protein Cas4 [Bacillota bacterium]|nr:CRISPR-associated protein Cas4 [Bacillota bacterium]